MNKDVVIQYTEWLSPLPLWLQLRLGKLGPTKLSNVLLYYVPILLSMLAYYYIVHEHIAYDCVCTCQ